MSNGFTQSATGGSCGSIALPPGCGFGSPVCDGKRLAPKGIDITVSSGLDDGYAVTLCVGAVTSRRPDRGLLDHQRRNRADQNRHRSPGFTVPREVPHDFSPASGVADVNRVVQIKMLDQRRKVISVMIDIMPIGRLRRATVTSPIMRDHTKTPLQEEQHLVIPIIGGQRPSVTEHDWLPPTPVLEEQSHIVGSREIRHEATIAENQIR